MKTIACFFLLFCMVCGVFADDIGKKTVITPAKPNTWDAFSLSEVRLLPGSPFHKAMLISQNYLLGMDVERMLNRQRRSAKLPEKGQYPGSTQPADTRPGDFNHYLSGISLMYGQTGDKRFLDRVNYIISVLKACEDRTDSLVRSGDTTVKTFMRPEYRKLLRGELELNSPDESGYPWGGMGGNYWYVVHKQMAALRDAYLYCNNTTAFELLKKQGEQVAAVVLPANPDLFDGMLDLEHGGMNEVFADLYALTGDKRYMDISMKFNHQKVILNTALGKDVLYARHANMQVPTFAGTARQYQLTGDEISHKATANFLDILYGSHITCIGGNSRNERFGRPGETTKLLGFTSNETCNTYNSLKVAFNYFQSTGDLKHMDFYERALYNHILASQDPESGGVTYYTALGPGFFKSYSNRYHLEGVWCCVGTGMENHSKYGQAIYFHTNDDLFVNLFIPSQLHWTEKGLKLSMETDFPEKDMITLKIDEKGTFSRQLFIRYPQWAKRQAKVWLNGKPLAVEAQKGEYIRISAEWRAGDEINIELPQDYHLEPAKDDPNMVAVLRGPLVLAGELGTDHMPDSDLVRMATRHREWKPSTADIPTLVVNKADLNSWLKPVKGAPLNHQSAKVGLLNGKKTSITLMPFYKMHHQRYTIYWKLYTPQEMELRKQTVSDEINPADAEDEKRHGLKGVNLKASAKKDERDFWENNRVGRSATNGGSFSYQMKVNPEKDRNYLVVTYWGSADKQHVFDVVVNGKVIKTENLYNRWPLTYYEEHYELPEELLKDKEKVTVTFRSRPGYDAGAVYGLKITSDPGAFPNYLFY